MENSKHAYLIMAHNDVYCYSRLIDLLDDERNDIFVHIDKKANIQSFESYKPRKSNIVFTERIDVRWADVSQVKAEIILMKAATQYGHYTYYHLLSGIDLPIKTQNQIHDFFDLRRGYQFVGTLPTPNREAEERVSYYHLTRNLRNTNFFIRNYCKIMNKTVVGIQKFFHIKRRIPNFCTFGPNWFSITDDFCRYTIANEDKILHMCNYSIYSDEVFLQTLMANSSFKNRVYKKDMYESCVRNIDWKRGTPYTWKIEDYEFLMNSDRMFARKFSSNVDKDIIDRIHKRLKLQQSL